MEVKFGADADAGTCESQVVNQPAANIGQDQRALAVTNNGSVPAKSTGLTLGDFVPDFKDIILPRLNLVQALGELKDSFPLGAIVHGQNLVLYTPTIINSKTQKVEREGTKPISLTVLGFRPTRFVEKVQGGGKGLIVDTEAQVVAAGGTLDYREWQAKEKAGMKRFEPFADALVAIARPDVAADDGTTFIYPVDNTKYALALWGLRGAAYTAAAKGVFFTARRLGCLNSGYPTHSFSVSTRLKSFTAGKEAWVPVCVPEAKSTPAFLEFAQGILNPA